MILGFGIDCVDLAEFSKLFKKHGPAMVEKWAHPAEKPSVKFGTANRELEYWAARFAVKEAFYKALTMGMNSLFPPKKFGVSKGKSGEPILVFEKKIERELKKRGIKRVHLSITHSRIHAIAAVILEGKKK